MIKNILRQFGGAPFFINGHCSLINRANRPATVSPQTSPQEEKAQARYKFSVSEDNKLQFGMKNKFLIGIQIDRYVG